MIKVQELQWTAGGREGAPNGMVFVSEWMSSEDVAEIRQDLKKRGIDSFPCPNIDESLHSIWVCNYTPQSEFDPAHAKKFFKSFPGVAVEGFDMKLLQAEPVAWKEARGGVGTLSREWQAATGGVLLLTDNSQAENEDKNKVKSPIDEEALAKVMAEIDGMIGLGSAKEELKQIIASARINILKSELGVDSAEKPSYHMCLSGNPGTGKTTLARLIAKAFHALGLLEKPEVNEVLRSDLVGDVIGQTERKTTKEIEKAFGGVLFIDEAYALSGTGRREDNDFGRKAIDTIVPAMENFREEMIFIFAGYGEKMKEFMDENPGLKSRCPINVPFEDFNSSELGQIMDIMLAKKQLVMEPEARELALKKLEQTRAASAGNFGNARDVRNLVEAVERTHALHVTPQLQGDLSADQKRNLLLTITAADVEKIPSAPKAPPAQWLEGIGFMAKMKV